MVMVSMGLGVGGWGSGKEVRGCVASASRGRRGRVWE